VLPNQFVDFVFVFFQILLDLIGMAHRRGGTDGFVRRLRRLLLFICIRRFRQIILAILRRDVLAYFRQRFVGDASRIGTHVSNEADRAFLTQFDAFVEALRNHHGALDAEA
jgi:hypothetical protein